MMVAALLLGTLGGCARYYWSKPNGTAEQFDRDSVQCAREAAPTPTAAAHGVVIDQLYRVCMSARGWVREKQFDPPPPGSFRGVE
jgi:hypothetical protein